MSGKTRAETRGGKTGGGEVRGESNEEMGERAESREVEKCMRSA